MKLGFVNARTLLQSGNLVFRGGSLTGAALEQHLEREAGKRLGLQIFSSAPSRNGERSLRTIRFARRRKTIRRIWSWPC